MAVSALGVLAAVPSRAEADLPSHEAIRIAIDAQTSAALCDDVSCTHGQLLGAAPRPDVTLSTSHPEILLPAAPAHSRIFRPPREMFD